jgi:hypothetical protein
LSVSLVPTINSLIHINRPNTGASPPSLQPVEIPAEGALKEGGKGNRLERRAQVSELFSMEICDMAVMDFLAAMDVGKFLPG